MTTLRQVLGKTTVQAVLAVLLTVTLCYLVVRGDVEIDGATFAGLVVLALAFYFRAPAKGGGE